MCREFRREPAWVAAIHVVLTAGRVDVEAVMEDANLVDGRETTVEDVLETMAERGVLEPTTNGDGYRAGEPLRRSAPSPSAIRDASSRATYRWNRPEAGP